MYRKSYWDIGVYDMSSVPGQNKIGSFKLHDADVSYDVMASLLTTPTGSARKVGVCAEGKSNVITS